MLRSGKRRQESPETVAAEEARQVKKPMLSEEAVIPSIEQAENPSASPLPDAEPPNTWDSSVPLKRSDMIAAVDAIYIEEKLIEVVREQIGDYDVFGSHIETVTITFHPNNLEIAQKLGYLLSARYWRFVACNQQDVEPAAEALHVSLKSALEQVGRGAPTLTQIQSLFVSAEFQEEILIFDARSFLGDRIANNTKFFKLNEVILLCKMLGKKLRLRIRLAILEANKEDGEDHEVWVHDTDEADKRRDLTVYLHHNGAPKTSMRQHIAGLFRPKLQMVKPPGSQMSLTSTPEASPSPSRVESASPDATISDRSPTNNRTSPLPNSLTIPASLYSFIQDSDSSLSPAPSSTTPMSEPEPATYDEKDDNEQTRGEKIVDWINKVLKGQQDLEEEWHAQQEKDRLEKVQNIYQGRYKRPKISKAHRRILRGIRRHEATMNEEDLARAWCELFADPPYEGGIRHLGPTAFAFVMGTYCNNVTQARKRKMTILATLGNKHKKPEVESSSESDDETIDDSEA